LAKNSPITDKDNWYVGEDKTLRWTVYQDDDITAQAVTGWTAQMKVADAPGDTAFYTETATVFDGPNGILEVASAAADTSAIAPGKYFYTLSRTNAGSNAVIADGDCVLKARVA
jgi:ketosteroid isomerase-like protein